MQKNNSSIDNDVSKRTIDLIQYIRKFEDIEIGEILRGIDLLYKQKEQKAFMEGYQYAIAVLQDGIGNKDKK